MRRPVSPPSAARPRVPLLALGAGAVFVISLDATVGYVAYPALRQHFADTAPATLSWILNAYSLVYAALLLPLGRFGDRHGHRFSFLVGVALFAVASLAAALAPGIGTLIAARAVQAVGAALLSPSALALVLHSRPTAQRAVAVSLLGAAGALAAAVGPVLGSALIELVSWRAIFLINFPLCIWLFWKTSRLPSPPAAGRPSASPDWFGSSLLIAGVAAVVFAGLHAGRIEGDSPGLVGPVGCALLAAVVLRALHRPDTALDLRLFDDHSARYANLGTVVFGAAFGLMFFSSFLFLTGVWGYGQSLAGLAVAVGPLLVVPCAVFGGHWGRRSGHRPVLVAGGALFALGQTWYLLRLGPAPDYLGTWFVGQLVNGAAIGLVLPALSAAAVANLPAHNLGAGNAINTALRQLASVFGVALGVNLVGHVDAELNDFQSVHALLALAGVLTALVSWPVRTAPGDSRVVVAT